MKCPVCNKEINRPLHITKMKDDAHKQYVESQKQLAVQLLKSGMPLVDIKKDERIVIINAVEYYLNSNYKEEMDIINRKTRNERISKAKYKDGGLRKKRQEELENIISHGIEGKDYIVCKICGYKNTNLTRHITVSHELSANEYRKMFNINDKLFCQNSRNIFKENMKNNNPNDNPDAIKKMKRTKASTKSERVKKAKEQFANGERKVSDNIGRGLNGIRPDLGHNCRSMWEANIARILKLKNIEYEFENQTYAFYDSQGNLIDSYLPDFYLPKYDAFLEVKGQMDDVSLRKLELFEKEGYRVIIIEDTFYSWLINRYKNQLGKRLEISGRNIKTNIELFQ